MPCSQMSAVLINGSAHCIIDVRAVNFEGNRAAAYGGAVFLTDNATVTLHDVKFLDSSSAWNGGAMAALGSSDVVLGRQCISA